MIKEGSYRGNKMEHLQNYFKKHPVIAGVRDKRSLQKAIKSQCIALFILNSNIMELEGIMDLARKYDKLVFLHIDLIKGIARDKAGVNYLAEKCLCDGIVTTKSNLIKAAKKENLMAVQRLFLLDSAALETGKHLLESYRPDAVEILPGIAAPYFIAHIKQRNLCSVIAGGLIRKKNEVKELIDYGVMAISTSNDALWNI